ncbi:TIGR04222 domain-containing membrane protein [Streptomycetaceae bacterium NBC_01309]
MVWLVVSAALLAVAVWYARSVLRAGRARGNAPDAQDALDLHRLAFLAGGPARVADVAVLTAWARSAVAITPDGRVAPGTASAVAPGTAPTGAPGAAPTASDGFGAAVDNAVRVAGGTATVAGVRLAVADAPAVRALRDPLFGMGLLNPPAHTGSLRTVRIVLSLIPLIAIAGLFAEPLSGSPSDDTALWSANLAAVLIVTGTCCSLLFFLFTRYNNLRAPLNDSSLFHLWNLVRDPASVQRLGDAVPGGHGLGEVALFGPGRIADAALREVFLQAARVTAGRVTSDGWTEQQWQAAVESRGPLGAPTYADAYRASHTPATGPEAMGGAVGGPPGTAFGAPAPGAFPQQPHPGAYGGGAAAHPPEQRPPWESHPNA